jgi:DNA-binding response OmpR family regulator
MHPQALVVEDDTKTRTLLRSLLEAERFEVEEAGDGVKALELMRRERYDVVLLDIVLPKLSGTEVMDYLRLNDPRTLSAVIVVTGIAVEEIRKLFPSICDALGKPIIASRLMSRVRQCVNVARVQESARPN